MKKSENKKAIAVDLFERKFREEIEWRAEQILDEREITQSEYDEAYAQAVIEIAAFLKIELI
jgi:hypothetical protein